MLTQVFLQDADNSLPLVSGGCLQALEMLGFSTPTAESCFADRIDALHVSMEIGVGSVVVVAAEADAFRHRLQTRTYQHTCGFLLAGLPLVASHLTKMVLEVLEECQDCMAVLACPRHSAAVGGVLPAGMDSNQF